MKTLRRHVETRVAVFLASIVSVLVPLSASSQGLGPGSDDAATIDRRLTDASLNTYSLNGSWYDIDDSFRYTELSVPSPNQFSLTAGLGVLPFSLSAGFGICASSNRKNWILLEVSSKYIPLLISGNVILIGLKHQLSSERSTDYFSLKFGPVWTPEWSDIRTTVNGGCAELDYGYDYVSGIGLGASFSIGVTAIVLRPRSPVISPTGTINLSWSF